jgi:hypothetical protein
MTDDFAAFRAAHPSVGTAIEKCDRPDWAIRLAFEAADDKRAIIANGANIARVLKTANLFLTLITPWPEPVEALDVWADNTDHSSRTLPIARAVTIAAYLAIPLTWLLVRFVVGPRVGSVSDTLAMGLVFCVMVLVIAVVAKLTIAAVVRRQVARLDESSALELVLSLVTKRMVNNPIGIRRAMRFLHLGLPRLVDRLRS